MKKVLLPLITLIFVVGCSSSEDTSASGTTTGSAATAPTTTKGGQNLSTPAPDELPKSN